MSILSVARNGSTGSPARNTNAFTMSNCVVSAGDCRPVQCSVGKSSAELPAEARESCARRTSWSGHKDRSPTSPSQWHSLRYHFILPLARNRYGAHLTETPQAMIVMNPQAKLQHLERAPQIPVQTTLLRLAVERSRAMDDRISGVDQPVIFISRKTKLRFCDVSAKHPHPRSKYS